jgi:hypothetical protein
MPKEKACAGGGDFGFEDRSERVKIAGVEGDAHIRLDAVVADSRWCKFRLVRERVVEQAGEFVSRRYCVE